METIPQADTLDEAKKAETPAASTNTPANGTSPAPSDLENELERERARASTAQRERDEAVREARDARRKLKIALQQPSGSDDDNKDDKGRGGNTAEAEVVQARAERRVMGMVIGDAKYQDLLAGDPTLRDLMLRNPLSFIGEFIDEDDAVEQVQDYLDKRLAAKAPAPVQKKEETKDVPKPGAAPAAGGTMRYTPEQLKNMSPDEYARIPKEERMKMMKGELS